MIGPIITDIQGLELSQEDSDFLSHPLVGGVILFTRNYAEPKQLHELTRQIKSLKRQSPLLISVDQEGGPVQRFREHFTVLPPMAALGKLYLVDPAKALEFSFLTGWLLAAELRQYNIDYSYTPVLDLDYQVSKVIGKRAFHADPEVVLRLAKALIEGLRSLGMAATGKHFPGHGAVSADSHTELPIDKRDLSAIFERDLLPYIALIEQSYLDGVMTAHIVYSEIDPHPVCFSFFWIQSILRSRLHFKGVIISDDLTMEGAAIAGGFGDRAEIALHAGCDMLLICNNRNGAMTAIDKISQFYTHDSQANQRCHQLYAKPLSESFNQHPNWQIAAAMIQELNQLT